MKEALHAGMKGAGSGEPLLREVDVEREVNLRPSPSAFWLGGEGGRHMSDILILAL